MFPIAFNLIMTMRLSNFKRHNIETSLESLCLWQDRQFKNHVIVFFAVACEQHRSGFYVTLCVPFLRSESSRKKYAYRVACGILRSSQCIDYNDLQASRIRWLKWNVNELFCVGIHTRLSLHHLITDKVPLISSAVTMSRALPIVDVLISVDRFE